MDSWEWTKLALEIAGPAMTSAAAAFGGVYQLGRKVGRLEAETARQSSELRAQSRQLEWQSRAAEIQMKRTGSEPPPREKLATLDEHTMTEIAREVQRARNERKE